MKTLTIRLDDAVAQILQDIKEKEGLSTLNATINLLIKTAQNDILDDIRTLFTERIEVDTEKFRELNIKYGLLQKKLF